MPFNNRILAVLHVAEEQQPALERACLIAARLGGAVDLIADKGLSSIVEEQWLDRLAKSLADRGMGGRIVGWTAGGMIENVLRAVQSEGYGLVVKRGDQSHPLAEVLHTPRDWKLMRYLPCPVLLTKQQQNWESRPLIAAIDAVAEDADHRLLNEQILQVGQRVAEISHSPLHVISAYPAPMQSARPEQQSEAAIRLSYETHCHELCDAQGYVPAHLEVAEGPAEVLIPAYAQQTNAGLVIMGTVARSGLKGALLGGNTAEAILGQLGADVLALKPQGYDEILRLLVEPSDDLSGEQ